MSVNTDILKYRQKFNRTNSMNRFLHMDEVLEEFDFDDSDILEFTSIQKFKQYLDNMGIPYEE